MLPVTLQISVNSIDRIIASGAPMSGAPISPSVDSINNDDHTYNNNYNMNRLSLLNSNSTMNQEKMKEIELNINRLALCKQNDITILFDNDKTLKTIQSALNNLNIILLQQSKFDYNYTNIINLLFDRELLQNLKPYCDLNAPLFILQDISILISNLCFCKSLKWEFIDEIQYFLSVLLFCEDLCILKKILIAYDELTDLKFKPSHSNCSRYLSNLHDTSTIYSILNNGVSTKTIYGQLKKKKTRNELLFAGFIRTITNNNYYSINDVYHLIYHFYEIYNLDHSSNDILKRLTYLLSYKYNNIQFYSLKIIRNILHYSKYSELIVNHLIYDKNLLNQFKQLLSTKDINTKSYQLNICWILSNIPPDKMYIYNQCIIKSGILSNFVHFISLSDADVVFASIDTIYSIIDWNNYNHCKYLIENVNILDELCKFKYSSNSDYPIDMVHFVEIIETILNFCVENQLENINVKIKKINKLLFRLKLNNNMAFSSQNTY